VATVLLVGAVSACGGGSPEPETSFGQVGTVGAGHVCIGSDPPPIGVCYVSDSDLIRGIEVGDCVQLTAVTRVGRMVTRELTAIRPVAAADHPADCTPP
jgi:hypothetical protein